MYEGETFLVMSTGKTAMIALMDKKKGISIVNHNTGKVMFCLLNPTDYEGIALLNNVSTEEVKKRLRGKIRERKKQYNKHFEGMKRVIEDAIANKITRTLRGLPDLSKSPSMEAAQAACPARRL